MNSEKLNVILGALALHQTVSADEVRVIRELKRSHEQLLEALRQMSCTCVNPDGSYPHDEKSGTCNLSIAKLAISKAEEKS